MATTEELLAQLEQEIAEQADEEILVISNDLRTISIPSDVTLLGVESDDDVHRIKFQMPATYGEFDLSTFDIRINYMNANNEGDVYAVEDKASSGGVITFSWLVGRRAAAYRGDTKFIVCLKKAETDGTITQEFNTTVATLPVLEGLETTEAVVQNNADIIEQILRRLDALDGGITITIPTKVSQLENDSGFITSADTPAQIMTTTDTAATLEPNILYVFPEMATLTVTLATPTDTGIVNEYHFFFDSGATATELTMQCADSSTIYTDAYSIDANMRYEVSVLNNVAYIKGVSIA